MTTVITSFKQLIEVAVRESFEAQMLEAVKKIQDEAMQQLEARFKELRITIKKEANELTLQMLQKQNMSGLSVEIKL